MFNLYKYIYRLITVCYPWTARQILHFLLFEFIICLIFFISDFFTLLVLGDLNITDLNNAWIIYYKSSASYFAILKGTIFSMFPYHFLLLYTLLNLMVNIRYEWKNPKNLKGVITHSLKVIFIYICNVCIFHAVWLFIFKFSDLFYNFDFLLKIFVDSYLITNSFLLYYCLYNFLIFLSFIIFIWYLNSHEIFKVYVATGEFPKWFLKKYQWHIPHK